MTGFNLDCISNLVYLFSKSLHLKDRGDYISKTMNRIDYLSLRRSRRIEIAKRVKKKQDDRSLTPFCRGCMKYKFYIHQNQRVYPTSYLKFKFRRLYKINVSYNVNSAIELDIHKTYHINHISKQSVVDKNCKKVKAFKWYS